MSAQLVADTFVFATVPKGQAVPDDVSPKMVFQEAEGTTLVLPKTDARRAGLDFEYPCRMITLNIHSSLEAVGFMARIATALAASGLSVNPVSGFYHDHLFVPEGSEIEALNILRRLSAAVA